MFLHINTFAPGTTRIVKVAADCCVLALASTACATSATWNLNSDAALATMALATTGWLLGSHVLGQYDASKKEGPAAELVLVSALVLIVTGGIALLQAAVPYAGDVVLRKFLVVLWPGVILLRSPCWERALCPPASPTRCSSSAPARWAASPART